MLFAFLNRERFNYTAQDVSRYFTKCFCLRNVGKYKADKDLYRDHK